MNEIINGFILSGSLIIALGAQNAFVLQNAILKNQVFIICLICFLSDAILMSLGIFGVGGFLNQNKFFMILIASLGAIFLFIYGILALKRVFQPLNLKIKVKNNFNKKEVILKTIAITYLNPHVYLDTVVIVGGIGATLGFYQKIFFLLGSILASFIWFFSLGYGASYMSKILSNPKIYQIIDFLIAFVMFFISFKLILFIFENFK